MNERSEVSRLDRLVMRLRKDVEFTHNVTGASVKGDIRTQAADAISAMQHWIREQGKQSNTCTKSVLGEACENCRCRVGLSVTHNAALSRVAGSDKQQDGTADSATSA